MQSEGGPHAPPNTERKLLMSSRNVILVALAIGLLVIGAWVAYGIQQRREAIQMAANAYIYALPLVLTDVTREETFKHPAAVNAEPNRMYNIPILANASFRTVVRPNVDTLYSVAWLSLEKEPIVLTVPASEGRYFLVQFMDAWTNVFAAPGIRTLGNAGRQFFIVGPGYHGDVPAGMEKIVSATDMVWVLGRIHVRGEDDLGAARAYQNQIDIRPYSRTGDASFGPALPDPRGRNAKRSEPPTIVRNMDVKTFYERFLALTKKNPPAAADLPFIRSTLEPLGLSPSSLIPWSEVSDRQRDALKAGMEAVWRVFTSRDAIQKVRTSTGWAGLNAMDAVGAYGTNYRIRAGVAVFGLGANLAQDAVYLNASVDEDGNALQGGKRYRIHMTADNLPPVKGFWSITLYDGEGYLVDNPINRYAIRQYDQLNRGPDGSLDIYIQPDDPGPARRANWLPSPRSGSMALSLRAYWPEERILSRQWIPPGARLSEEEAARPEHKPRRHRITLWTAARSTAFPCSITCTTTAVGDVANRKRVYLAIGCFECHGGAGQGGAMNYQTPALAQLELPVESFVAFLRAAPNDMPAYSAAVLSDEDTADIHALLRSLPGREACERISRSSTSRRTIVVRGRIDPTPLPGCRGRGRLFLGNDPE